MYEDLVKSLRTDHDKYFARDMEAADAIEELQKACEEAYNKGLLEGGIAQRAEDEKWLPKWIPVTERLPEEDVNVLLCYEWTGRSGTIYREVGISSIAEIVNDPTEMFRPLYWMHLPEPPKEET